MFEGVQLKKLENIVKSKQLDSCKQSLCRNAELILRNAKTCRNKEIII